MCFQTADQKNCLGQSYYCFSDHHQPKTKISFPSHDSSESQVQHLHFKQCTARLMAMVLHLITVQNWKCKAIMKASDLV